ncbi:GntR family transcriptional regulator [Bradyrhizobium sp. SSUT112]|uniref:GntR family transcriptional regulator n=1 Tax=Bradyrhizobium sp. SSUT112 TaxID=3040604 RepID=UPI00244C644B|nr:GntR family transcriptional regulator [Bradyrhizobium sp. SSUT112]MDH2352220.1 GntR family transcriptional regulator [Bradyrhizobium sp. SSUT112]
MPRPNLATQMTARILDYIRVNDLEADQHLPSQALADALRVSRAPINAALQILEDMKVVRSEPNRGFFLVKSARELPEIPDSGAEQEDEWYFAIAEDRLSGKLPERVSESELMRRYGLSRTRLLKVLTKIADEGWIERLPGNGWAFGPLLTSRENYQQGYQLRIALEPQALLLPSFKIDRTDFAAAREKQQWLLDGGYKRASRAEIFAANNDFHEMLMACGGNPFFLDAVKRVNRLRRLVEYHITVDRSRLPQQCREHLNILDLLENGLRQEAADFLRVHISGAGLIKIPRV